MSGDASSRKPVYASAWSLAEIARAVIVLASIAVASGAVVDASKVSAKKTVGLSRMKQVGLSLVIYSNDWDDVQVIATSPCTQGDRPVVCSEYTNDSMAAKVLGDSSGGKDAGQDSALSYLYWSFRASPYVKSYSLYEIGNSKESFAPTQKSIGPICDVPGLCTGAGFGGQNTIGANFIWGLSGPTRETQRTMSALESPGQQVLLGDASFYVSAPDTFNQSGMLQHPAEVAAVTIPCYSRKDPTKILEVSPMTPEACDQKRQAESQTSFSIPRGEDYVPYKSLWKNDGAANYAYARGENGPLKAGNEAKALELVGTVVNCSFADGHSKSMKVQDYLGNLCYWVPDPSRRSYCGH